MTKGGIPRIIVKNVNFKWIPDHFTKMGRRGNLRMNNPETLATLGTQDTWQSLTHTTLFEVPVPS
jgi:hypothetical protein